MSGVLTFECQVPYWVFFLIWALPLPNAMTFWIIAGPRAGRVTVNKAVGYLYGKNGYRLVPVNLLQGFPHFWSGLCSVTLCTFCKDKSILHQLPEWILGTFSPGEVWCLTFQVISLIWITWVKTGPSTQPDALGVVWHPRAIPARLCSRVFIPLKARSRPKKHIFLSLPALM